MDNSRQFKDEPEANHKGEADYTPLMRDKRQRSNDDEQT